MGYYCNKCDDDITGAEYRYSKNKFNRALCRECQKKQPKQKVGYKKPSQSKSTPEAKKLVNLLRQYDWKVETEKWDGFKHIDIAIVQAKVNIEVDGIQHNKDAKQALSDLKRTFYSFKKGYATLRIPNCLVRDEEHLRETARYLNKILKTSEKQIEEEGFIF